MKVLKGTHVVDGTLSANDDPVIHRSVINSRTLVCEQLYILFHSNHSQTSSFPSLPLSVVLINLDEARMYLIASMPSARWPSNPQAVARKVAAFLLVMLLHCEHRRGTIATGGKRERSLLQLLVSD